MKANKIINKFFLFSIISSSLLGLDNIIPAEIKNDGFYKAIYTIASREKVEHILEIGSSSGDGSTEAFVLGIRNNPSKPNLYCMEISIPRFQRLKSHYANDAFVHCFNVSSVSTALFPEFSDVANFMNTKKTPLNSYSLETVKGWYDQDLNYLKNNNMDLTGINEIKSKHNIDKFDIVLIDGSEFTGKAELDLVYGAKLILLDDTLTYKNAHNYERLSKDNNYVLIEKNDHVRNGYAIFKLKK